jgi:large subunit ribosomal protein L9
MPEAILLKDVETLGEKGTVVDVSKGYLRNYLIPRKLAQPATRGAVDAAQRRAAAEERAAQEAVEPRRRAAPSCSTRPCSRSASRPATTAACSARCTTQDIADAIQEARGITVDRRKIHLDEPIKHVGTYMVVVGDGRRRDRQRQDDGQRAVALATGREVPKASRGRPSSCPP